MGKLLDFSMGRVAAVAIIVIMLVIGGVYAASSLKVESMPDVSFPEVYVITTYPGTPPEVDQLVTKPLEKAISGVDGIQKMTSASSDNYSEIYIELSQSKKLDDAKKDIESAIAGIGLPARAGQPVLKSEGFASFPVFFLSMYTDDTIPRAELERLLDTVVVPSFQSLSGLDHLDMVGDQNTVLNIRLNGEALNEYGLSPSNLVVLLKGALAANAAGSVEFDGQTQMVKVKGQLSTLYDLERLELRNEQGEYFQLQDVAFVESVNRSTFTTRLNGSSAVGINLYKTKNANAIEFAGQIESQIDKWQEEYPYLHFQTVMNTAEDIKRSIHGMLREGALGALLASVMILFFLRNVRMTAIVLVSIPLSILISLLFMNFFDITLNIMTLGGLTLAIGRVVDDSIVVIENIYNELQKAQERNESVIKKATIQVGSAITSSTLTTVAVFAPIGFVSGIVGQVFRPFAITLVCSLMASLFVAVTIIPLLAKLIVMRKGSIAAHSGGERKSVQLYRRLLTGSLKHRKKTVLGSVVLFVLSVVIIVPLLPSGFLPESESDKNMYFTLTMPKDTSMDTMDAKSREIEDMLLGATTASGDKVFDYVEAMVGYNYSKDRYSYITNLYAGASSHVKASATVEAYEEKVAAMLPEGAKLEAGLFTGGAIGDGLFTYSLKGDRQEDLQAFAATIREEMSKFPELKNIKDSLSEAKTEVEVVVDQGKAKSFGLDPDQITEMVRGWITEEELGELPLDNTFYKTYIQMDPAFKNSLQTLEQIPLQSWNGTKLQLRDVAHISEVGAPDEVKRENQKLVINITAQIDSSDVGGVSSKVVAALNKLPLPQGISRDVGGVSEEMNESFKQLFVAIGMSILIVYLVMVITFGNATSPLVILISLPLAVIGGLLGLLITGESINVASLIGFLMLIGIVVTNAIVLIDRVEQLRREGLGVREALIEAGLSRLRPILMTAGATIIALVPLALGFSDGTIISRGLGIVVIGGLTTSTLLTLLVVPVVYEMNEGVKSRIRRLFSRGKQQKKGQTNVTIGSIPNRGA